MPTEDSCFVRVMEGVALAWWNALLEPLSSGKKGARRRPARFRSQPEEA